MQTDSSIPYPRPNYSNGDLISKEMVNGTFIPALFQDLKGMRPPMDRYNVTEDKLTDISLIQGNITPQAYDLSMNDVTIDRVKEIAWQPAKRVTDKPEPIVIYDPKNYYTFVEWSGVSYTEMPYIQSTKQMTYDLKIPYYDDDNAGLFGFQTLKDADGNVTDIFATFFSLKDYSLTVLGRVPNGYDVSLGSWVGYTKGAYILNFYGGTFISFTLTGEVFIATDYSDDYNALGDDGILVVEGNIATKTHFLNINLQQVNELSGRFCVKNGVSSSTHTKYLFGTKIDSTYYYLKDDNSSYKYRQTSEGWKAEVIQNRVWAYTKRIKFDYVTDNWLQHPLKTLKYNIVKQGLFVLNRMPKHEKSDEIEFPNSDMYGDFGRVVATDGSRGYFHTFDFKTWVALTGDAKTYLYGCIGRLWINDRLDGVSGLMPFTIALKTVNGYGDERKTVLQYSGFIFRGGN